MKVNTTMLVFILAIYVPCFSLNVYFAARGEVLNGIVAGALLVSCAAVIRLYAIYPKEEA